MVVLIIVDRHHDLHISNRCPWSQVCWERFWWPLDLLSPSQPLSISGRRGNFEISSPTSLNSIYHLRTRRERLISQAAVKSLLKMISDRDQSQAGRLQESLSQQERLDQGRVGGFLRFSSVDTLLSGVLTSKSLAGQKNLNFSQMRAVDKRNHPSVRQSALWLTNLRLKNQEAYGSKTSGISLTTRH